MRRNVGLLVLGLAAISLAGCSMEQEAEHHENETPIAVDQLPAAVRATLTREAEGGAITDVDREQKEQKTVYEADAKISDKPYEIKVAEDGTLISKKLDDEKDEHGEKD